MTARARIVRDGGARSAPLLPADTTGPAGRRIVREEAEGRAAAERILAEAQAKADAMVAEATVRAAEQGAAALDEARARGEAEIAARWLTLRQAESRRTERESDRIVPLAVALAERLLGAALELDPARIASLTRAVLDEARGARRARIDAHPVDAGELARALETGGLELPTVEIHADAALARGELRLHTELGTIDARLAPRFERLAVALRDALDAGG